MGSRWNWVVGWAALLLALLRLGKLIRPTIEGAPWQVAVVAGALMGAIITWAMRRPWASLGANAIAFIIVSLRIVTPDTLTLGIIPTATTIDAFRQELALGINIIRFGVAPVSPIAGLVVILTLVFWALGALLAWGNRASRPLVALLPPLLFYLQLAVIDQMPSGLWWMVAFLTMVALALISISRQHRLGSTVRMRSSDRALTPTTYPALFIVSSILLALLGVRTMTDTIPSSGLVDWRAHSAIGGGVLVGVSYNLFTSIHQDLVSHSNTPVFAAKVAGDVDPSTLYWQIITLEDFDGANWIPRSRPTSGPDADTWEDPDEAFFGTTAPISTSVRINSLVENYLPVVYSPTWLGSDLAIFSGSFDVRTDGSVHLTLPSFRGLTYQETALVPKPDVDVLASQGGFLTPIFREAADQGVFEGRAVQTPRARRPEEVELDLELPKLDPVIQTQTRVLTADGTTPFEKALLLEAWFHDPANFTYSTDIDAGHSARNLADWLFATDSPSYRTGYCEQFATAMAVMARTIGIPSRVVTGFGPGEVQPDGTIVVRDRNAHAWVELWMDTQGWVRFDPTPGGPGGTGGSSTGLVSFDARDYVPPPPETTDGESGSEGAVITRDVTPDFGENQVAVPIGSGDLSEPGSSPFSSPAFDVAILLLLIVLSPLMTKIARRRRRIERLKEGYVSAAWNELIDRLSDLGTRPAPSLTPLEFAGSVHQSMIPLADGVTATRFGRSERLDGSKLATATRSFLDTEAYLKTVYPVGVRIRARMRLRSLFRRVRS